MRRGVVVDLDRTFIKINSFEFFYIFLLKYSLVSFKMGYFFKLFFLILGRKCKLYSHEKLKYYTLIETYSIKSETLDSFSEILVSHINYKVIKIINEYKEKGYTICLATAAPILYVENFVTRFKLFDSVVCTSIPQKKKPWEENLGITKLNNVKNLFQKQNCSINVVITDHADDIPLLLNSEDTNYLVSPSKKSIAQINKHLIKYKIIQE
ncbi:haloacid dehalogenase-like hydrolase [Dysgonomonas sp. 521]|uniref:HAD family hydrolase n=1 Tax=Dysgonomonas sp. 521 TaxID=2302932 RepID=UPI0013D19E45|nr:HAD family hydrolase [Dysgonomonas sp. 521]NDV96112.1 haloacid dehalogenase-like hydrolase [Dysgonomonas sp. 521]